MKVAELSQYGGTLQVVERPVPEPGPGQVRVRVQAAAINPIDRFLASGAFAEALTHIPLPIVLGWDVAGTVDAVADGVPFKVGESVAASTPWFERGVGTFAELVVLDAAWLARVPDGVDPVLAATLPVSGQTARQSLDMLSVRSGQSVLVTGASGAVGGFAVQLAAAAGARVLAVASLGDEDRVRGLGATDVLSRNDDLVPAVRQVAPDGVDAVLDAAPVGPQLIDVVRDGGAFVTVLDDTVPAAERGVRVAKVAVRPEPSHLEALLDDLATGRLTTSVAYRLPLDDVAKAFELSATSGLRGKVVLVP